MSTAGRGIPIGPPWFKIAVHSVVWLAKSGSILSSAMIASHVNSHATFLRRVMQALASSGIVESKGGRDGGYLLVQAPEQITLGDIYSAVRMGLAGQDCGSECTESLDAGCGSTGEQLDTELEKILYETELHTIDYLRQFTIIDFMGRIEFDSSAFRGDSPCSENRD